MRTRHFEHSAAHVWMCANQECKNHGLYFYDDAVSVHNAAAAYYLVEKAKALLQPAMPKLGGVELIGLERLRQIREEFWTPAHDDTHTKHELALAAMSYIAADASPDEEGDEKGKARPCYDWPWEKKWWKPSNDPIRNLVKAGALIAAEIDRLLRAANTPNNVLNDNSAKRKDVSEMD